MLLHTPFSNAFGLDIGDLSIKLMRLKRVYHGWKNFTYKVTDLRAVNLPPGYIVGGEIQQPEMVRRKILYLLGKEGNRFSQIKDPWVVAGLPEPKSFLKLIEIQSHPEELTQEDIMYQAKKHLPFELSEAYIDWQVADFNSKTETCRILIGAVPKIIADSYTYLLESAGLSPIVLEVEAMSLARCLITAEKSYEGEARAILDLGATRSSLIIYDHDSLQLSTDINFSGEIITTAISQNLKMEYEAAEKLKVDNGIAHIKQHPRYFNTIYTLTEQLVRDIKSAANFYAERFNNPNPITHITMAGGVSNLKNLDSILSRQLKISTHPGNAWKNLLAAEEITTAKKSQGLVLASVIGLALRAVQKPW